jgi:hypothetical protein
MPSKVLLLSLCFMVLAAPVLSPAAPSEAKDSSYWTSLALEENSVTASVLYLPYLLLQIPVRMIDGIVNPKPASMSDTPPPAHRSPR